MTVLAADRFETYGPSHQGALVLLLVGVVAIVLFGRRHRGTELAVRWGRIMAAAVLAVTIPLQVLYFTPQYWDLDKTLPLQLCDLASGVAVYALWTRRRWAAALTYFWGLTLTSQAIVTPDLAADFPDPIFVLFWAMHLLVVGAAVYLVWALGLGPDWRRYRVALVVADRGVGGHRVRLQRRRRHQLRLPQRQAERGVGARPARPVALVRAERDRHRRGLLGPHHLAVGAPVAGRAGQPSNTRRGTSTSIVSTCASVTPLSRT